MQKKATIVLTEYFLEEGKETKRRDTSFPVEDLVLADLRDPDRIVLGYRVDKDKMEPIAEFRGKRLANAKPKLKPQFKRRG